MNAWNTHRNRFAVALTLLGVIAFASPHAGLAQVDVGACGAYSSQQDAQADLDANPDLAATLDPDGNGVACEGFQAGEPTVVDPVSCGFFETQADAQTALDQNPDLALTLDSDGDGVACDEAFPDVVVDPTSCGFFETQADAQEAFDAGTIPNPENLDGDGDGIACEELTDAPGDNAAEDDADDEVVSALPSTGSGPAIATTINAPGALAAGLLALMAIAGALLLRVPARRQTAP